MRHRLHAVHRCGLLLQVSPVAWSVCRVHGRAVHKRQNRSRYRFGGYSWGSKELYIRWGPDHLIAWKGHFFRKGDIAAARVTVWRCGRLPSYFSDLLIEELPLRMLAYPLSQRRRSSIDKKSVLRGRRNTCRPALHCRLIITANIIIQGGAKQRIATVTVVVSLYDIICLPTLSFIKRCLSSDSDVVGPMSSIHGKKYRFGNLS